MDFYLRDLREGFVQLSGAWPSECSKTRIPPLNHSTIRGSWMQAYTHTPAAHRETRVGNTDAHSDNGLEMTLIFETTVV